MEKIPVKIYENSEKASLVVAKRIGALIRERNKIGRPFVLGLATGNTPIGIYKELIRLHRKESLDFSRTITFNLDEYWPIHPDQVQSYHYWMKINFFTHVNIKPENIHIPSGMLAEENVPAHCKAYEAAIIDAGGIDIQILGIGRTGHIGFNEPGSSKDSRTRLVQLDHLTRTDAAASFFGEENVPYRAITMGVQTILEADEIILLAFGEHKAVIIQKTLEEPAIQKIPASYLQGHTNITFYLDQAAAERLTRLATPWKIGSCQWDDLLERKAVLWLSKQVRKPILKLTSTDYNENSLAEMQRMRGRAYDINLRVFHRMMGTITGWPGGRDKVNKILVFSPHPDEAVVCMAGTIRHLVNHGHEVQALSTFLCKIL
jgi:glucosamine-6-phosphate deaminase